MNKKYIVIPFLFFAFLIATYFVSTVDTVDEVKEVFNAANLKANCNIKEIIESKDNYDIKVYYPETKYSNLNDEIKKQIDSYITYFVNEIDGIEKQENVKYQLQIRFDSYEYERYISFVFEIFEDYGGAHPNSSIWTISYDIKDNKIVTIDNLIAKNSNILNFLSEYSFENLKENKDIKENYIEEMLVSGTKPIRDNFQYFAFAKDGFKLFFPRYSVAPYSSGSFVVNIPYDKIGIND